MTTINRTFATTIKTKLDKNGTAKQTAIEIVQDISDKDMFEAWACKSAIIAAQRRFRDANSVPEKFTVTLSDLAKRNSTPRVVTVESIANDATKLTPEQRRALLEQLLADDEAAE